MDSDEEFEYESEDGINEDDNVDEQAIQIENAYYEADDNKTSRPEEAINQFQHVVDLETSRGSEVVWRFKALQNIVVLSGRLKRYDQMACRYRELLGYMDKVTRNNVSEAINSVLDAASAVSTEGESGSGSGSGGGKGSVCDGGGGETTCHLETVYSLTLDALKKTANHVCVCVLSLFLIVCVFVCDVLIYVNYILIKI
eukprot:GHVR01176569.1.p1 GENE.GHVR01176569.1~~GHVR01176569.1.p1  ORF type:complete len:199 (+),score=64.16 GHVR01176569.1:46-642(+)